MRVTTAVVLALLSTPVQADEITPKDIQVIGRALAFMEDAGAGPLELGIVYVRGEAESLRQATTMQSTLGNGLSAGKLMLMPRLIATDELPTLDHAGALFIVPAAPPVAAAVAAAAAHRLHVPVISTNVACAQAGNCVLAFRSSPTIEIIFNRVAAEAEGIHFTPAFRMLVKQI